MARKDGKDRGIVEKPKGSGKWWVRRYVNGREVWHRCDSKSQAKALYGRLKAEQREGKFFEKRRSVPFRELANEYSEALSGRGRGKAENKARMDRWISAFGDQDVATITSRQIERALSDLKNEGRKIGEELRYRQPATLVRYLTVLKAIFNRAVRLGTLATNPAARVQTAKPNNVLVRYLTERQEADVLSALPKRFGPIVRTAVHTGLRQGELLRLCWQDLDWNVGVMTIHETKAGERRRVPMNSAVQSLLTQLKESTQPLASDRLFSHDHRYLRRAFGKAVLQAGLAPFRFHDLRHTFASRLAMRGVNVGLSWHSEDGSHLACSIGMHTSRRRTFGMR
jgi:integrase